MKPDDRTRGIRLEEAALLQVNHIINQAGFHGAPIFVALLLQPINSLISI